MEEIQAVAQSALQSIGAVQALAIAAAAGFIMRDFNQLVLITLGALVTDRIVAFVRQAVAGEALDELTQASWQSFLSLPMGTFLAMFIGFALVIWLSFGVKSAMKRL